MPELPEVENARCYLVQAGLPGRTFASANIGWAKTVRTPSLEDFVLGLTGGTIQAVNRRGKYLLLPLCRDGSRTGSTLIIHLGMTGGLRLYPKSQPEPRMLRHTFTLDDGRELRFVDGRKFGKLWLAADPGEVLPPLGPDPLGDEFNAETLTRSFAGRNAPVKALLLEQSIVAGMGNPYADESLFLAGVHPLRPAQKLSGEEIFRLRDSIVSALTAAVNQYDRSRTGAWPDPPMELSPWTIPRKACAPCPRCENPVEAIRVRGRGTCFCPGCQG